MRSKPIKVGHFGKKKTKKPNRLRKPKKFVAAYPGHCGAFDSIEKHLHGTRRYIITFVDLYSRFTLAYATTSHASRAAAEFFTLVKDLFPCKLEYVLTDNGSEFMKDFDVTLRQLHATHWHTYPRTPKMNAHCERYNRTIQEEFVDYHEYLLHDPAIFNQKLLPYLLWYNGERPHWS
jgi:transposase InsO family protein